MLESLVDEQGLPEETIELALSPAIINGEWAVQAVEKSAHYSRVVSSTDNHTAGHTFTSPYGMELKIAFPLVDSPKSDVPDGCISLDAYKDLLKLQLELNRFSIGLALQPYDKADFS
jgi:hypothetical protein